MVTVSSKHACYLCGNMLTRATKVHYLSIEIGICGHFHALPRPAPRSSQTIIGSDCVSQSNALERRSFACSTSRLCPHPSTTSTQHAYKRYADAASPTLGRLCCSSNISISRTSLGNRPITHIQPLLIAIHILQANAGLLRGENVLLSSSPPEGS